MTEHPNAQTLSEIYKDLASIGHYVADDVVLHTTDGQLVHGSDNVVAHERNLIELSGNSLVMSVEHIIANESFGTVLGMLHADRGSDHIAMPICGLWRFHDGMITEHWENAYEPRTLTDFLLA